MNGHATINRFYRLVWSEKQGAWVAVAENVRGRGKSSGRGAFMAALFAGLGLAPFAWAGPPGANQLPTGGQVVAGAATITQGGSQMTINQASQRGAIDWQTFNVGSQAQVNFQQPNSGAVTLNRVQDSQASQIFGRITANGQVFLSNPNGVYFSPTSSVNVGGLVATTNTIATADFMAGSNTFERNGATGSVVNDGSLNATLGGYIALLAPQVRNNGIVIAQAGTVAMAAGEQISLQFADSRTLAGVLVSPSAIAALVENGSAVHAPGGMIIMSAQAANELQGGVVRNTGSVAATGLSSRGGKIVLDSSGLVDNSGSLDASGAGGKVSISADRMASSGAVRADGGGAIGSTLANGLVETTSAVISAQGGGSISINGGAGKVYTSGSYSADGEQGGKVVITANDVSLMGAKVSATGASKGGTILIGGDYQGGNAEVRNAARTSVGSGVTLNADATGKGNGGKVVVWSDEKTVFAGELTARGGAAGGDGGVLEVSGKQTLYFGGKADAHAAHGKSGALLLDPKDIYIDSDLTGQLELVDPHPTAGGSFGKTSTALNATSGGTVTRTGYIVVTNPDDNLGATASGAAYLFRQSDQALISTLYGTHAGDKVGSNGVTSLSNGNYVVSSNLWNGGMGAVTWGNGSTGWGAGAVAVAASNSLVGSTGTHQSTMNQATSDNVGGYAITVLPNGNYLVGTPSWSDNRGALTFGDGAAGVSGVVSASNSLIGSTAMSIVPADGYKQYKYGDQVGSSVTVLANGNYVQANANWNKGVGAVTLGSGSTGIQGVVGTVNSLVGDTTRFDSTGNGTGTDKIGKYLTVLTGSQFVVYSSEWKNSSGAITWFDGSTPINGLVSAGNSLIGNAGDSLTSAGLTLLPSNNAFVISSPGWNGGRGAATWVPFGTDVKAINVASNGVVGVNAGDSVGSKAVTQLANGDYVLSSPNFNTSRGASTLVDGSTGKAKADQGGTVTAANSLVGSQTNDQVGSSGIVALNGNGNYVVLSPYWANGGNAKAGAVTWSSGTTPTVGAVGAGNSLVGTYANDRIGSYQYYYYQNNNTTAFLSESNSVTALANGNYVVSSPMFNGTRGAVTWSSGTTGATADAGHTITASNSLVGNSAADFIGGFMAPNDIVTNIGTGAITHYDAISNGVTGLSNGNYVTVSNYWRNGSALRAGAVTWSDGAGAPTVGLASAGNSLVGTVLNDMVGLGKDNAYGIKLLENGYDSVSNPTYSGNYLVVSNKWDNGGIADAGAVSWGSGTSALTGTVSDANSVLGLKTDDVKGWGVTPLPMTGNYLIQNKAWDNGAATGAGALTWINGSTGRLSDYAAQGNHNIVSSANSLVGSHAGDGVGETVDYLYNYDVVNGRQRFTGNYVALNYSWTDGSNQYAGAVTWGNGATGVSGVISRANSVVGDKAGDYLGSYYVPLTNGNYLLASPTLDVNGVVNAGAVSWIDGSTGRLNDYAARGNQNILSAANALVGSHTNDYVGSVLAPANYYALNNADYANNGYFIISPDWNCGGGAVNYISDATAPLSGVVGSSNAAVGNPNGRFWGSLTYNPYISLASDGGIVTFSGDNGHVVLISPTMPPATAMIVPGAVSYGDAQGATQAMTPDHIAGVLKTGTSVTLQANNDIFVKNGIDATGGVAGGALTMQAGRSITVLGDIITGNRDLNLTANDSLANGVKDAYRDAGIATLSMGVDKQGVAAKIDAGTGNVSLLMADGSDKTNHMAGSISVNSITGATIKLVNQGNGAGTVADLPNLAANCCGFDLGYRGIGADVTLNAGAVLSASGAGTAVTLAAKGNFNNNSGNGAGSIAMSDPAARWLVYANAPGGSTYGGLDSQNTAIWNASYSGSDAVQSGNRYLFAYQPTITVGTQNVSKTYGDDLSTGSTLVDRVVSLSGADAGIAGAYLGDTVATALSGTITATSAGAAANAGVAGGPYAITVDLSGATGNNGYAVALGSNTPRTITVVAKVLTASLTGVSKVYDASNAATLAAGNYVLSGLVGSESFSINQTSGQFNAADISATSVSTALVAGNFSAGAGTVASNYILPVAATGTGSITPKALVATLAGVSKVYDGSTAAVLNGGNYQLSGLVGGQSASVSQTAGLYNSADVLGASSVSASLSGANFTAGGGTSLANYLLPVIATGSAAITPKALSASLTGTIGKTYDGGSGALLSGANYSLSGFVGAQSAAVTQTAGVYNSVNVATASSVTASLSAGDFTAGAGTTLSNYSLPVSASGGASIAARPLSASLTGALGRSYDGTASASLAGGNVALGGVVAGETINIGAVSGSYDSRNAGARTVSATLAGGDFTAGSGTLLGNYVLPTSAAGTAVITPKAVTLNAPAISKLYDGTLAYTASAGDLSTLSGALVGGDTVTGATFSYADKNAGNGNKVVNLNQAAISDGNGGANYSVTLAGNSASTITPRVLNTSATGVDRVYDTSTSASVTLQDDRIAGDVLTLSNTSASFADKNAGGNKVVTVNGIAAGGADAGNYTLAATKATTTATITPATLQVTGVSAQDRSYDTTRNAGLSGTAVVTALGSDIVKVTGTGIGQFADKNAGTGKAITVSGYTSSDSNYVLLQPAGLTATVTPAVLALSGLNNGVSKTYDGGTGVSITGAPVVTGLGGETVTVAGTGSGQFLDKNAGSGKAITVSGLTSSDSNYAIGQQAGLTGTITPAQLTLGPVTAVTRSYDGGSAAQIDAASYAFTGLVGGESVTVVKTAGSFDSRNAGTRSVSISFTGADYTAGANTLLANYLLPTLATGSGVITPKAITLNAPAISKVYDGTLAHTTTAGDLTSLSAALVGGDTVTGATFSYADKNAGNGNKTVNLTQAAISDGNNGANYSVTLAGNSTSTITPRVLNASATGVDRVYDTSTSASVTLQDDRIAGDVLTLSNTSATFADKNAGGNKVVTVNGIAAAGADAGNYALAATKATTTATITPATLQVTGVSAQDRTYDTTRNAGLAGTAVVTALGSDIVKVTGTGIGQFADKNAGTGKAITVSGYTSSDSNYVLLQPAGLTATVTPAVLALSGLNNGVSKTYDGGTGGTVTGAPVVTGLGGEIVTVAGTGSGQFLDKNAGSGKAITVSGLTSSDSNYTIGQQAGLTGTITPAQLTLGPVTAVTRGYDGGSAAQIDAASYAFTGLVGGESVTVVKTAGSFDSRNAGNRSVSISLAGADYTAGANTLLANYLLPTLATGSGVITPKAIVLNAPAISKVYDGTLAHTTTAGDLTSLSAALVGGDTVTGATFSYADKNAGNGNKTVNLTQAAISDGNGGANYSVTLAGNSASTITPRVLNASATGVDRVYNGNDSAGITLADDRIAGDVLTLTNTSASFADKNAGSNKVVSVGGLAATGVDAGNYLLASTKATTSANIAPAQLALGTVTATTRDYDGTRAAQIDTASLALGGVVAGETIVISKTTVTYDSRNAGSHGFSLGLSGADYTASANTTLANYVLPTLATGSGVITPKAIVLNAPSISKVYDGTLAYSASSSDLSALSGALVGGDTVTGATFSYADKNAGNGNKTVNLTQAVLSDGNGGANYSVTLAGNSGSTITPRVLNASATGVNRVYDTSTSASVTLQDDRIAGDVLTLSNTSATFADKNAGGNKVITVDGIAAAGADAGNYALAATKATTTASITPATLQVTGVSAQDRSYDTSLNAALAGTAVVTALGSDIVKVTGTGIGQFLDKNAGTGKAITVTGYASSDSNYVLLQPAGLTATVTPAVLALSGLDLGVSKTYDGTTRVGITGAPVVSGFGNEVVTVGGVGAGQFADKNAGSGKAITVSGLTSSDSNYAIGQQAGLTGTITPAQLTLGPVTTVTRGYDGTSAAQIDAASYAVTGLVGGESVNVVKTAGGFDSRNAGIRTVSISFTGADYTAGANTSLSNYLLPTLATGSGTITPKAIVLNAPSISKVYDGTLAYSATSGDLSTLSGALVGGDTVTGATFSYADKNAGNGNKAVNFGAATVNDGNNGANYSVTLAGNSASTITPRVLNASATGVDRVYDTSASASVTLQDDRIAGDVLTLSNTSASFADKNAGGNKVVTVNGIAAAGADAGNYALAATKATTTATITPATLQVTGVSAQDRSYDTSLNAGLAGTAVVTALGSDIVKVTGTGIGQFADKNAGTGKAITVSGYASSDSNYVLLQPAGLTATVIPAVLALSGLNLGVSKTYDGTVNVTLTGAPAVSGFGNEVVTVGGVGRGQFLDKNAGSGKAITVSGLIASDSNYVIGQQAGLTGTITPAQLTIGPVTAATRGYDGTSNAQIDAGSFNLRGLVAGDSIGIGKTAGSYDSRNAGNRSVSISLAGADYTAGANTLLANYLLPTLATGSGVITPKAIVLNAPAISKVYDGTLAYSATASDLSSLSAALVQGDTVAGASFSYADKNAGNGNKVVNLTQAAISDGNGGGNYSVTLAGNSGSTITPRMLNASATGVDRVYDTSTSAGVSLRDDRIAGDVLTLSNTSATFADKNAGSNKVVTVNGIAVTGTDGGNYSLAATTATTTASITPATLQVTGVTVQQRSYDRSLNAVLGGAPTVTALGNDVVSVLGAGSGSYADKNAGTAKAVTVTGYRSSDSNYVLLQPAGLTGTVTPAVLQVSGLSLAAAKTYDGTRNVALSGTATVTGFDGEVVTVGGAGSGQFADKNVGTGKAITLAGYTASDSNYAIGQQPGLVGSITPAAITVTGVRANSKTFDGNATATLNGMAAINVIGQDEVALTGTASASFADATAGTAKPVSVSGYALAGADAGNYALSQPQGLSADIADTAVQVPPPVVVTPPPLPSLPLAEQRVAPGLSMPPLGDLPVTGTGLSSTAPVATPAPASVTPAAQANTAGITVSLVRPASQQQSGAIAVSVPKQIVDAGNGFGFPLPAQVVEAAAVNRVPVQAQMADGSALPSWISYNADSKSFVVTQVPSGALPLEIVLVIGSQRATMVVAESR